MEIRYSVVAAVLALAALLDVCAAVGVWRRRLAVGRLSLTLLLVAAAWWSGAYALELATVAPALREFWGSAEVAGAALLPPAWLLFVLDYTQSRPRPGTLWPGTLWPGTLWPGLLALEPAVLVICLLVPETHDLVRHFGDPVPAAVPVVEVGPLYWAHFAYANAMVLVATAHLVVRLLRVSPLYRRQSAFLLAAVVVPLCSNVASSLQLPFTDLYDPTPVALSVGLGLLLWGAYRYRLLDLLPVARGAAFDRLPDPVLVVDAYGRVVDRNPAAIGILGHGADVGTPLHHLLQEHVALLDATAAGAEVKLERADGTLEFDVVMSPLDDQRGQPVGRLVQLRDITARKEAERRLRWLADFDPLTQLPNRRYLHEQLDRAISRARRDNGTVALLIVDLDRFKLINDGLGHPVGDRVLACVGQRLLHGRHEADTAARLGGDEFAIVLPGSGRRAADLAGRAVLAALAEPMRLGGHEVIVTGSAGLAVWPDDGPDGEALFSRADAAMYRAKGHGRNRAEHCDPAGGGPAAADRRTLGVELWHALRKDQLFLRFQPLVDLRTRAVTGVEALVRWQHPDRGVLAPAAFLPVAEETGLMVDVDRWVFGAASRQARGWLDGGTPVPVSVNVSAEMVRPGRGALAREVAAALDGSGLPPDLFVAEIDEQTVVDGAGETATELERVRRLGVRLALDGFGAGHTSLTHLRRLPIGMLKIDRSLVAGVTERADDRRILTAVAALAEILDLTVVAEGVESAAQAEVAAVAGCAQGQGFYFSAPLAAPDVAGFGVLTVS